MKGRILLTLPALLLVLACEGTKPTDPTVPIDPSKIILDGAHGGNKDFFFLPPMVPLPRTTDFELGKFNNALQSSLRVEICELVSRPLNALPLESTRCANEVPDPDLPPLKTFTDVKLVNLPIRQNGWWTLFGLPPDGFYYVLWDTRKSNLVLSKYYRIKVFLNGKPEPLGVADVDPMSSLREWKSLLTGQVIQLVDDVMLPIPFRVEKGAFCEPGSTRCTSVTVTNNNPSPQIVQLPGNTGPIAGIRIPAGKWLPDGGPQSVVFNIALVNTGVNDVVHGTQQYPCHAGLPDQQFNACVNITTIPKLDPINVENLPEDGKPGDQFLKDLTAAVCFTLADRIPLDPREPWAQLWASDVGRGEAPHPLKSAVDVEILTVLDEHNCGTTYTASINSGGMTGLASAGWRKLKGGLSQFFGVKTAYAVDVGLGGLFRELSRISPVLTAELRPYTSTELSLETVAEGDVTTFVTARMVGTQIHDGKPLGDITLAGNTRGLPGLPVIFTLEPPTEGNPLGNGFVSVFQGPLVRVDTVTSSDYEDSSLSGGLASVIWTVPNVPGTYTLTVTGQAVGSPLIYTATVVAPPPPYIDFEHLPAGAGVCDGATACPVTTEFASRGVTFSFAGILSEAPTTASLCLKGFNPVGETPNYGVSPATLTPSSCGSWYNGAVTMSFASNPTTVEFLLQGNNGGGALFPVTALDALGNPVTVTRESVGTYSLGAELIFRREVRRATSPNGIASVVVNSPSAVLFIDNLLITPFPSP